MDSKFVGPMPVAVFIENFLPLHPLPTASRNLSISIADEKLPQTADDMILAFASADICPNSVFINPATKVAADAEGDPLPFITIYPKEGGSTDSCDSADMFIDRFPLKDDPFRDPETEEGRRKISFQRTSERRIHSRRKQAYHAFTTFDTLTRHFLFSVLLLDDKARFIRWDRSGAVVTELFKWNEANSPLVEFLTRFDSLSPKQKGFDPTVSHPSSDNVAFARTSFERAGVRIPSDENPIQICVQDEISGAKDSYVCYLARPTSGDVAGRASAGFLSVRLTDGVIVWIKDSWRSDHPSMPKESDIYRRLMDAEIPHVAPMLAGGDVEDQKTRTAEFRKATWACASQGVRPSIHHRLVLGAVGRSLRKFKSTFEMTTAVRDAVEAHGQAFSKLNLLHGDISPANILITEDGHGILIDWELAIDVTMDNPTKLTGTWPFTSARLLEGQGKKVHTLSDDLESFVYVLAYQLIRHRPTNIFDLELDLDMVFHQYPSEEESLARSTKGKVMFFQGGLVRPCDLVEHLSRGVFDLLFDLRELFFHAFYPRCTGIDPERNAEALRLLETPTHVLKLFDIGLATPGWQSDDASLDVLKKKKSKGVKESKRKRKREESTCEDRRGSSKRLCSSSPLKSLTSSNLSKESHTTPSSPSS